ncbi:transposase DDE domain protein [Leptospira borgpetersenii str. Noumea 25]|uniref:Transposase DDE domain protein n=1 Tax=Leptospira borgpetersenii serovar Ballum TaxID=280505 RepID=A0A0E3BJD1_LEPBO|nr:transposase DDE domain protein [Leptospira borgpetersenii serovar Ballum]EKR01003.1 transposase DDE domain protein [Leptospira borgpetersenii serovar Castellonis str. 200801910]EMO10081.1 transposase DDE domain protein [Leptospira borgpetersenii str. Noumea 25]KGE21604.1 transposase [Leptospira borgpetersenii serovar Ballum]
MKPSENVDDKNSKVIFSFFKNIFDKLFGDKGYISQPLFENLFKDESVKNLSQNWLL